MRDGNGILNIPQAAKELGVHENTIRNYINRGLLRAFKPAYKGARSKIRAEDLQDFRRRSDTTRGVTKWR